MLWELLTYGYPQDSWELEGVPAMKYLQYL